MNMQMKLIIPVQELYIETKAEPSTRNIGKIVGFAEVTILDKNEVLFIARGYTIRVKQFGVKPPTFIVDAPAYKSGYNYKKSFIIENKSLWKDITNKILEEFSEKNGGKTAEDYFSEMEEVNLDDIPL